MPKVISAQMDKAGRVTWALFEMGSFRYEMILVDGIAYSRIYAKGE